MYDGGRRGPGQTTGCALPSCRSLAAALGEPDGYGPISEAAGCSQSLPKVVTPSGLVRRAVGAVCGGPLHTAFARPAHRTACAAKC